MTRTEDQAITNNREPGAYNNVTGGGPTTAAANTYQYNATDTAAETKEDPHNTSARSAKSYSDTTQT